MRPQSLPTGRRPPPPPPDQPEWITPEEAAKRIGKYCKVEMFVQSTNQTKDQKAVFLDSKRDFDAPDDFQVSIFEPVKADIQAKVGVADLKAFFLRKRIHVAGDVTQYKNHAEIVIHSANQIGVVDAAK